MLTASPISDVVEDRPEPSLQAGRDGSLLSKLISRLLPNPIGARARWIIINGAAQWVTETYSAHGLVWLTTKTGEEYLIADWSWEREDLQYVSETSRPLNGPARLKSVEC